MVDVVRTKFWQKIKGIKGFHKLAFNALVLYFVIADSDTPKYVKGIAMGALVYFIDPIDALVDITPVIGFLDDMAVLIATLKTIHTHVKPEHRRKATSVLIEQ